MIWLILGISVVTLAIALWLMAHVNRIRATLAAVPKDGDVYGLLRQIDGDLGNVEAVVADLQPRVASLEERVPAALSFAGVVSYDAFGDIAGNQSRSVALLSERGDGVVITLLVGRNETLFYTKQIRGLVGLEPLAPEEQDAIDAAMRRGYHRSQ